MKVNEDAIKSVGLTLLYEPDNPADAVVDVVLIHGIGGHPVRSWKRGSSAAAATTARRPQLPTAPNSTVHSSSTLRNKLRKNPPVTPLRRSNSEPLLAQGHQNSTRARAITAIRKNSLKSISRIKLADFVDAAAEKEDVVEPCIPEVFWPLDLLPASCPKARISTWGYHTLVVDKKPLRLQNDIFAHAGELLLELATARAAAPIPSRPIIFIAHSTGGLLLKEALRIAEAERDGPLKEILHATSGVVFMACPHRASERSTLTDAVKSMASVTLHVDSNDQVLQELSGASSNTQLEMGRLAFIRIWNDYNFKVKTFQESVVLSYRILEVRLEATARRLASFLGDPRESAETISATHGDVCRFGSSDDPGFRSISCTVATLISREEDRRHVLNTKETECLAALVRPHFTFSETHPATSYPGTCLWLYDLPEFHSWHHRSGRNKNKMLWIRGESGCGKTILLRSLRRRLERQWTAAGSSFIWTTAEGHDTNTIFFPGTRRQQHEINPANVYRSLLAQLFLQDPNLRKALLAKYNQPRYEPETLDDALVVSFFADDYIAQQQIETPSRRTFIFVDVSDDAGPAYVEELICRLSQLARNSDFSICVASAHHPELEDAINIPMDLRNSDDILRYVNLNLVAEWEERNQTVMRIGQKAAGVFLWAEIVVNILNAAISEGASQDLIEYTLEEVPSDLHGLYEWMLATLNEREKAESLILFQWVILAAQPMRLNDLFLAVRLTEPAPFASYDDLGPFMALSVGLPFSMRELRQLRNSEITSDTPYQFHRWLRARSIGLLELKSDTHRQGVANEPWGLQKVQPIHSSVRSFFLAGRGFACLAEGSSLVPPDLSPEDFIDLSHYSLVRACLTYLNMRDFENLGHHHNHYGGPHSPGTDSTTSGMPNSATTSPSRDNKQQSSFWQQRSVLDQRSLIISNYPFLQYAVDNLLFHLLSPRLFRYFLPQRELLLTLSANRFRLWRRWTSLLGVGSHPDPAFIFHRHAGGPAAALLSPVFGARYRLERVFRKLGRLSTASSSAGTTAAMSPLGSGFMLFSPGLTVTPITPASTLSPRTPRTPVSAVTVNSTANNGEGGGKQLFWVPPSLSFPRASLSQQFRLPPTISLPVPPAKRRGLQHQLQLLHGEGKSPVKRRLPPEDDDGTVVGPGQLHVGLPEIQGRPPLDFGNVNLGLAI
ncbi:hypothetical protein B0H66DRAFT_503773 [Apodospora peruviana]|uniref:Nephrocystin 3-like N-terminal domain-containing protein n=1 Tax=Apodospora peruviana TaxID=516989 RepID=A0AAE0HW46_9PEZI|nr:hypothetical protein B0H66DRAFT_503773 [Apodospora peruviana]